MEKALANYLFHNETLYAFHAEPGGLDSTERVHSKPQKNAQETSGSRETDRSSPLPAKPEMVSGQSGVFTMKTKHLVVVKDLAFAEKELLEKIMAAIKLKMSVVDLLDVSLFPAIDFKETIYGNSPKAILFFGPESGAEFLVRLKLEKYSPKVLKGINFLLADNLTTILKNENNEKKKLWECLKSVFQV